jgi:ABC-2 type transport system permease protein
MTTTTPGRPVPARPSTMDAAGIPLARLTRVELRKLSDTRAGFWLLLIIALATVGTALLLLFGNPADVQTFRGFLSFDLAPVNIVLPVLGILSMTTEWTQRTALATFTLVPSRSRVIAAKLLAVVLVAVAATLASTALSALGNLVAVGLGGDGSWHLSADLAGRLLLSQVIAVLMGSAFGALLMNSPLAIASYLGLPVIWTVLVAAAPAIMKPAGWLDLSAATGQLSDVDPMTGGEWARLGVSVAVWMVLPLIAGTIRALRREVS